VKGTPKEYIFQSEFIGVMKLSDKQEYFQFLTDSGIDIVHE